MRFRDRTEGGRALARQLMGYAGRGVIVLALPRGGVPVGAEVARALDAPLDVFIVRKLGVPGHEELAMGAIASGGVRVINAPVFERLGLSKSALDVVALEEERELQRRERVYRGMRPPPEVRGRTVILVDDGIATGSTMLAAIQALRRLEAGRIVAAAPTAARETMEKLAEAADEVVAAMIPDDFDGVGQWYKNFSQTTDDEVCEILQMAPWGR